MATCIFYKAAKSPGDSNFMDASELTDVCKGASEIKELILENFAMHPSQGKQGGTHTVLWELAASSPKLN